MLRLPKFRYLHPKSVAEAAKMIADHGPEAMFVAGGTDLFALVQSDKAPALHSGLAEKGIWTRAFPDHPMWLRFGQPGTADEWERLSDALDALGCLLA